MSRNVFVHPNRKRKNVTSQNVLFSFGNICLTRTIYSNSITLHEIFKGYRIAVVKKISQDSKAANLSAKRSG